MLDGNGRASGQHTTGNPVNMIDRYSKANNYKNKRRINLYRPPFMKKVYKIK